MSRHDTNQGEWDGCHNNRRQGEVPKLPDYQYVDEHECRAEGDAHVAEGLVGDSPLTSPLEAGSIGGLGWPKVVTARPLHAIRGGVVVQEVLDREHPIDGGSEASGNVANHILNSAQILVKDG